MKDKHASRYLLILFVLSLVGMALRWTGISFEGVDYVKSLLPWYEELKASGSLHGLAEYRGDYNLPYVTLLYFLTWIPMAPIISIKMSSILFDYLLAILVRVMVREAAPDDKKDLFGTIAYGLILLNPVSVINSGYLAQCESVWAFLALYAFWMVWKGHPACGMLSFGFSFAIKPQGIFILPIILILYFKEKKFSILHLLWAPVGIQLTCIPAILGGCGFDVFFRFFKMMMGHYPFVYYYYPNIWIYLQKAPYYVFGKVAIFSTFAVLLIFAVLYVRSREKVTLQDMFLYITWTAMTCAMLLPCMHERYNYLAELLLMVCAIRKKRYCIPALVLQLASMQCNGQSYLDWPWVSHYALAAFNIAVYLYLTRDCMMKLYRDGLSEKEGTYAENRA